MRTRTLVALATLWLGGTLGPAGFTGRVGVRAADALPAAVSAELGFAAERLAAIDPAMQSLVDEGKFAGLVVLVARQGKVAHAGVYGQMDREAGTAMRREALFRIYSMSKPITSVALLTFYDEGRFALDDPVAQYLPALGQVQVYAGKKNGEVSTTPLARPITIRDLLRHTAGLAYGLFPASPVDAMYREVKILDRDQTLDSLLERLAKLPLAAQPGERWMYSVAVDVQGKLIEALAGRPLDVVLAERIFTPLGMVDTDFYCPADKLERMTVNYGPGGEKGLRPIDPANGTFASRPALLSGGGGLVSSADDYLRFCQMLLGGGEFQGRRVLRAETVAEMTTNQLPDNLVPISLGLRGLPNMGFGLGVSVRVAAEDGEPAGSVGEYGWGGAASTQFFISPREELVCVAMTQFMPSTFTHMETLHELIYAALEEPAGVGAGN